MSKTVHLFAVRIGFGSGRVNLGEGVFQKNGDIYVALVLHHWLGIRRWFHHNELGQTVFATRKEALDGFLKDHRQHPERLKGWVAETKAQIEEAKRLLAERRG